MFCNKCLYGFLKGCAKSFKYSAYVRKGNIKVVHVFFRNSNNLISIQSLGHLCFIKIGSALEIIRYKLS